MLWYKFGIRIYLDKSLSPLRVDTYVFICPGNFVHQVTSILPKIALFCQYSIINMLLTTYSLKSIYLVWLENLHSAKKTLLLKLYKKFMSNLKRKFVSNLVWKYEHQMQMESFRRNFNCIILYSTHLIALIPILYLNLLG